MEQNYTFENVNHALIWATEVMRRHSRPRISNIYDKGLLAELEMPQADVSWSGFRQYLPTSMDEQMHLASIVWKEVKMLDEDLQKMIRLSFFGDWYSDKNLQGVLAMQNEMRKQGKRMRLNHRYGVRQVATLMDMNYRTLHRKLESAKAVVEKHLFEKGLLDDSQYVMQKAI